MSETMKVFLACALGAFIGTVVALEVNHYFWWVGPLVGGFVGYISYEFKKVIKAIPVAWRKARGWRPDWQYWRILSAGTFGTLGLFQTTTVFMLLFFSATRPISVVNERFIITTFIVMTITGFVFGFAVLTAELEGRPNQWDFALFRYSRTNPISMIFWVIPRAMVRSIRWTWRHAPAGIEIAFVVGQELSGFAKRFSVELFREIHSDLRLLCGTDAALGAAVGYFAGNALIGALAGGLWGALNFEILSIRVLKLVPLEKSLFR